MARCGTVFPVSAVVGAAVPAAVCRWGLRPSCPAWCGEVSLGGIQSSSPPPFHVGDVNLFITNEGFGTPVPTYKNGVLSPSLEGGDNPREVACAPAGGTR